MLQGAIQGRRPDDRVDLSPRSVSLPSNASLDASTANLNTHVSGNVETMRRGRYSSFWLGRQRLAGMYQSSRTSRADEQAEISPRIWVLVSGGTEKKSVLCTEYTRHETLNVECALHTKYTGGGRRRREHGCRPASCQLNCQ